MKGSSPLASHTVFPVFFAGFALLAAITGGCSGARLSHDEIRKQIAAIGTSALVPGSIQIERIVSQSDKDAIAETTVALAFEFKRDKTSDDWHIAAVRLGDRDWISVDELTAAVNEVRRKTTLESLQKLQSGIANYKQKTGSAPAATEIVALTNLLHPTYMPDLIRIDGWGRPLHYEVSGTSYRLSSYGADGVRGTSDDIQVAP
jgi:hypothetical protein